MKKLVYVLMVMVLAVSFYGCSKVESEAVETEDPVKITDYEEYWVMPGDVTYEDIEYGKELVNEFFYLMYNSKGKRLDNESISRIESLVDIPNSLDSYIEKAHDTIKGPRKSKVESLSILGNKSYTYPSGGQIIVYNTFIEVKVGFSVKEVGLDVMVIKRGDKLKIHDYEVWED